MKIRLVEPISPEPIQDQFGRSMYHVRPLTPQSPKYSALMEILGTKSCLQFLNLGQWLLNYLGNSGFPCKAQDTLHNPLYLMTDFSDPRPLQGLRIEADGNVVDLPSIFFLGFYTDWEDIQGSGVADIFGHEYAHLWFYLLNFDPSLRKETKFHTCTAVTDVFTAFFEGFAEHLQIVSQDLAGEGRPQEIWDHAMDIKAWLCYRDKQLRHHAVVNNRFVYQTALPEVEGYSIYADLHLAHITSSAFTPEKLKNGSQVLASEGAVASVFYHIYQSPFFKNQYCAQDFYQMFGTSSKEVDPVQNFYLKIFHALAKTDLQSPRLFTEFVGTYGECFPEEREELYKLFLELTHFTTVSHVAPRVFGDLYRYGRRGDMDLFRQKFAEMKEFKDRTLSQVLRGELALDAAVYPELWLTGKEQIPPVPWESRLIPYQFDVNTASEVDFLALGISLEAAKALVRAREAGRGFASQGEFHTALAHVQGIPG